MGYIGRFGHRWVRYWLVGIKGKRCKEGEMGFHLVVGIRNFQDLAGVLVVESARLCL